MIDLDEMMASQSTISPHKTMRITFITPTEVKTKHGSRTLCAGEWDYRPDEKVFLMQMR